MVLLLVILAGIAAGLWLIILLLPWQPWRNREVLEVNGQANQGTQTDLSDVTIIIPARDEAAAIALTLVALISQGAGLRVILVDDRSSDGTAEIASQVDGIDLQIINGEPLPDGWSGKLWAQEQGLRQVRTPLVLLLDADICLGHGAIAALKSMMQKQNAQFVSVMATLYMHNFWEKLLNPAFIYFFKMLYPFRLSNSASRHFASAAGGCILLEKRLLDEIGGLQAIRGAIIDDCTLARQVKRAGFRTWTGQSRAIDSNRSYQGLAQIWNMVARTAFTQLRYSILLLLVCTFMLVTLFWVPLLGLAVPYNLVRWLSLGAWLGMTIAYSPTLLFYERSPAWTLLLPLTAGLYLAMTWSSALRYWRGERSQWKGRVYRGAGD